MSKLDQAPEAYTFDDFVLVPQFSTLKSRKEPDVSYNAPRYSQPLPVFSSPMNTITETSMVRAMLELGAGAVIHRYLSIPQQTGLCRDLGPGEYFVAVGATGDYLERAVELSGCGVNRFCVDVANGHSQVCVDAVRTLKQRFPGCLVMSGDVCTYEGVVALAQAGTDLVRVGIGCGCFAAGTRVLMADGTYKDIQDIKIHDQVITQSGKSTQVVGVQYSGLREVIKYKTNHFYTESYATPDHKHFVGDYSSTKDIQKCVMREVLDQNDAFGNTKFKWKRLDETNNCCMLLPREVCFDQMPDNFEVKLTDFVLARRGMDGFKDMDTVLTPNYDLGYIFGTFLGDGCSQYTRCRRKSGNMNVSASTFWYFGKDEQDVVDKLSKALKDTFDVNVKIKSRDNMINVVCRNNFISRMFQEFGKRDHKHLPLRYWCKNEVFVSGLYDGLIDSDGSCCLDGRVAFNNTSKELMEQFMILSYLKNGYFPSMKSGVASVGGLKGANLTGCKTPYVARTVKHKEWCLTKNYQINRINSQEQIGLILPTYDIQVEDESSSFIANNSIVHNSMCSTRLVTGHGVPQLSALEDCARAKDLYPDVALIADGGIKRSGDVVKALAIGADFVMLGSLLSGTLETPGNIIEEQGKRYKYYAGMASELGRSSWFEANKTSFVPEGVSTKVPYTAKSAKDVVEELMGGLRVGMSYSDAHNLAELRSKAQWRRITSFGWVEGTPHGKKD